MDDRIEAWARECIAEDRETPIPGYYRNMNFARFAALVRAAALEEAARVCEVRVDSALGIVLGPDCAGAIRALATPS